jgi:hypothetical protein
VKDAHGVVFRKTWSIQHLGAPLPIAYAFAYGLAGWRPRSIAKSRITVHFQRRTALAVLGWPHLAFDPSKANA